MYGYIYITTNNINNKQYIGQHKSETFDEKYKGSGKVLTRAFEKYGKENFTCEILKECFSKEELDREEKNYINIYNCVESDDFYNLIKGGYGGCQKGLIYVNKNNKKFKRIKPEELDYYISLGYEKGGYIPTEEQKLKRANSHVGKKYQHSEHFLQHGSSFKGRKMSPESIEKMALKKRGVPTGRKGKITIINDEEHVLYIDKEELPFYESLGYIRGFKKHSQEAIENLKIGKSGVICIHKEDVIKYIKPDELDNYLENGWGKGRGRATRLDQKQEQRKWMTNGIENKMVKGVEVDKYLSIGYVFGRKEFLKTT